MVRSRIIRTHTRRTRQGPILGQEARTTERVARRFTPRRQAGRDPSISQARRLEERDRQDHRGVQADALSLHRYEGTQPGPALRVHFCTNLIKYPLSTGGSDSGEFSTVKQVHFPPQNTVKQVHFPPQNTVKQVHHTSSKTNS